ncbi:MAG: hypothetical protein KGR26_09195 [Cyanobacteria bacterium REEB65]|nr:hypothetical protein [Cyanobacteria bacterium REEB65]
MFPQGAEPALALLVALGGLEVGVAMPTQIAIVQLVRTALTQGAATFASALASLPSPSPSLIVVSFALGLAVLSLSGGWIRTALTLARGESPGPDTWLRGIRGAPRVLAWSGTTLGAMGAITLTMGQVALFAVHRGLVAARSGAVIGPSLLGIAGVGLWSLVLGAAVYYLASSCLGAVVAIAEPRTPFWSLFGRGTRVFLAGGGWQGLRDLAIVLGGWFILKAGLAQFLVPFRTVAPGWPAELFGVSAALVATSMALGNALLVVLVAVMGAIVYERGRLVMASTARQMQPGDPG